MSLDSIQRPSFCLADPCGLPHVPPPHFNLGYGGISWGTVLDVTP